MVGLNWSILGETNYSHQYYIAHWLPWSTPTWWLIVRMGCWVKRSSFPSSILHYYAVAFANWQVPILTHELNTSVDTNYLKHLLRANSCGTGGMRNNRILFRHPGKWSPECTECEIQMEAKNMCMHTYWKKRGWQSYAYERNGSENAADLRDCTH